MSGYDFNMIPTRFEEVKSDYRKITTELPVPESLEIIKKLEQYESRSMHGQYPIVWDRAEDFIVYDKYGNQWIDFTSTIFVANAGHSNPLIKNKLKEVIDSNLLHSYTYMTEIRAEYIEKLIDFTPSYLEKAFLLSSGTEATECALKLMRMYGQISGKQKGGIISFEDSMHGRTMGAQMLGGNPQSRSWIGYEDPNIYRLPFPYPWLKDEKNKENESFWTDKFYSDLKILKELGVDFKKDICGIIIESYIGWGAIMAPNDYITELVKFAGENEILVAFDEIQGGFGRTGKMFTYEHYNVIPDLVCCGKGISSSLPLSAVIGRREIMDIPEIGSMSSTHSANPLSCAAGLANIQAMEEMDLINEAARKGEILRAALEKLKTEFPQYIKHIFGKGLVYALIIVDPTTGLPNPDIANRVSETAMQKGLLLVHTGRESIKIGPPLTIPDDALTEGVEVLAESFREVLK